jgi:hypothetical protein
VEDVSSSSESQRAYEESVLAAVRKRIDEPGMEDATFRVVSVELFDRFPRTRIVVLYRQDGNETMHGYWVAIWEVIAWNRLQQEAHGSPIDAAYVRFAGAFTNQMLFEAIGRQGEVTDCDRVPPSSAWRPPDGIADIRWTRGGVRLAYSD